MNASEKRLCCDARVYYDKKNGTYVEVTIPSQQQIGGMHKTVSVDDFCKALTYSTKMRTEKKLSVPIFNIPPNIYGMKEDMITSTGQVKGFTCYFCVPGCRRNFKYLSKDNQQMFDQDVPWPNLFFRAKSENGYTKGLHCWAYKDSVLNKDTQLLHFPFGNVGADGKVCMGGYGKKAETPMELWEYMQAFYMMTANDDLWKLEYTKAGKSQFELLNEIKDMDRFPTEYLVEAGKQVKAVTGE